MRSEVVICGNDATLLATRRMLLERAGLSVQTVLGASALPAATREPLVLCYSLSEAEQQAAVRSTRAYRPEAKILVLGGEHRETMSQNDHLSSFSTPAMLIERVKQLVQ